MPAFFFSLSLSLYVCISGTNSNDRCTRWIPLWLFSEEQKDGHRHGRHRGTSMAFSWHSFGFLKSFIHWVYSLMESEEWQKISGYRFPLMRTLRNARMRANSLAVGLPERLTTNSNLIGLLNAYCLDRIHIWFTFPGSPSFSLRVDKPVYWSMWKLYEFEVSFTLADKPR